MTFPEGPETASFSNQLPKCTLHIWVWSPRCLDIEVSGRFGLMCISRPQDVDVIVQRRCHPKRLNLLRPEPTPIKLPKQEPRLLDLFHVLSCCLPLARTPEAGIHAFAFVHPNSGCRSCRMPACSAATLSARAKGRPRVSGFFPRVLAGCLLLSP